MLEARRASVAAAMLAVVLVGVGCGSSARGQRTVATGTQFGTLGGYVEQAPADSVGASWRVSAIAAHSPAGFAATWIGAQHDFGAGPFIQVGTNAMVVPGHRLIYYAFWSDVRRHFNPQRLFFVGVGDVVLASLQRSPRGWSVTIRDSSSGQSISFHTSEEADGSAGLAEWLQEDPSKSHNGQRLPYPQLGAVSFKSMLLNSHTPSYGQVLSQWMTAGGHTWGPSMLRNGAFTMDVERLSGAAARYLAIAGREDLAINAFERGLAAWSETTKRSSIAAQCAAVASALSHNAAGLRGSHWPAAVRPDVAEMESRLQAVLAILAGPPRPQRAALLAWQLRFDAASRRIGQDGRQIRRVLGLPQVITQQSLEPGR